MSAVLPPGFCIRKTCMHSYVAIQLMFVIAELRCYNHANNYMFPGVPLAAAEMTYRGRTR